VWNGNEVIWRLRITENFIKVENVTRKNEKRSLQISRDLPAVSLCAAFFRFSLSLFFLAVLDVRFSTSFDANEDSDGIAGAFLYTAVHSCRMCGISERISIKFGIWLH
jgi:hypothetical protein